MSARTLGLVAITVMGLWHLLQGLSYGTWLVPELLGDDPELAQISRRFLRSFVAHSLAAAVLLTFRKPIAAALLPDDGEVRESSSNLQAALFSVVGLVIAVFAIRALVGIEFGHFYTERVAREEMENPLFQLQASTHLWTERVRYGSQLVLGAGVLFGARGLAGAVRLFREAGRRK